MGGGGRVMQDFTNITRHYNWIKELPIRFYSTKKNPWQKEAHKCSAREVFVIGGTRSGKTVFGATRSVFFALGYNPYTDFSIPVPNRGWVVARDFDTLRQTIKVEMNKWLPRGTQINKLERKVQLPPKWGGSVFWYKTYEQGVKSFGGRSLHWIWLDEEPPLEIFRECKQRLIDHKGYLWVTMTPDPKNPITWVYKRIFQGEKLFDKDNPEIAVFQPRTDENLYLPPEEIEAMKKEYKNQPEQYLIRFEGKMIPVGGITFPMFRQDIHTVEVNNLEEFIKKGTIYVAIDQGIGHPTACLWAVAMPDDRIYFYREYKRPDLSIPENCYNIKQMMYGWEKPLMWLIDPETRKRDVVMPDKPPLKSVYEKYLNVAFIPANNNREYGLEKIKEYMKVDDMGRTKFNIIKGTCPKLIEELTLYNAQKKENDDLTDCCRYIIAQDPKYVDYNLVKKYMQDRDYLQSQARDEITGY